MKLRLHGKNWKSKETLRVEAEEYDRLRQEAEEQAERTLARLEDVQRYTMPKTYVLAKSERRGVQALENLHLNPRAYNVRIITEPRQVRGHRLENCAHIIYSDGWDQGQRGQALAEEWQHALSISRQWRKQWFVCETI